MKLFAIISVLCHLTPPSDSSCDLPLHGAWEKLSPLILRNSSLVQPQGTALHLNKNENITLICPDARNYITLSNANVSYAVCDSGNTVKLINQKISYEEIQCKKTIRGRVLPTKEKCASGAGLVYNIGYGLPRNTFYALIKVCYDGDRGVVFYTEHLIYGRTDKGTSVPKNRPSFSPEGVGPTIAASVAYTQAYQKSVFGRLLKSSRLAAHYIHAKSFLARGHLSPDADFLLAAYQFTSYYYINTSPQWQAINGANWKRVESAVRKLASGLRESLRVITGNSGVMKLPDVNETMVEIYLEAGSKLPVPQHVWKIVYSERRRLAVVLVVVNNPFVNRVRKSDLLCRDICEESEWYEDSWTDIGRGFVYCCDYEAFLQTVPEAPQLQVDGILLGGS